jgi:hypothetical protein
MNCRLIVSRGVGVGPRQVFDIESKRAGMTPRSGPIMHFLRAKKRFLPGVYGQGKAAICSL